MGVILIPVILIVMLLAAGIVSVTLHKSLVKHEVRWPFLWSTLSFFAVILLASLALYYGLLVNFQR